MACCASPTNQRETISFLPTMFCGSRSFSYIDDFPGEVGGGGATGAVSPKGSRRMRDSKNPYATRGLDKFSTVLAELETRREMILARANAHGSSMVRFMYNNSNDWIPVIVRVPDPKNDITEKKNKKKVKDNEVALSKPAVTETSKVKSSAPLTSSEAPKVTLMEEKVKKKKKKNNKGFSWPTSLKVTCYWPAVMILILFCLVIFGRVFAICCTSIWWYLVPTVQEYVNGGKSSRRLSMKKKDYKRKPSDMKLVVGNGKM